MKSMLQTAAATEAPFLRIRNLAKSFGAFVALRDISLDIFEGEFVCFLGPSGCGKTTLLRAIAGLDLQSAGHIEQAGRDVSALPPSHRDFGIVFQSYALFPNLTVEKNIAYGLENTTAKRDAIAARVNELLALVGLSDQGKKYPSQLSGGQQQRIALARALAMSPGLLLLDEPLSALDAKVRVHLRHEIKSLQRRLGVTTIMVTHDQEEALSMADRIVVMNHGVVEQVGTPTEIYREPATLFVADFIGETNRFAATAGTATVTIGTKSFDCLPHRFADGAKVIVAIRPDDIIPHGEGARSPGAPDVIKTPKNVISVLIEEMEFLGSFWRTRLQVADLGAETLIADFSVNAVRRLKLNEGLVLEVELPIDRIHVFSEDGHRG